MTFVEAHKRAEPFMLSFEGGRWAPGTASSSGQAIDRDTRGSFSKGPAWPVLDWPLTATTESKLGAFLTTGGLPLVLRVELLSRVVTFEDYATVSRAIHDDPEALALLTEALPLIEARFGPRR